MRRLALPLLVLVLASVASAQSVPCEALPATLSDGTTVTLHVTVDANGNANGLCSTFTTQSGFPITNGGLPVNFTGDTQDGSPANGAINFTYGQHAVGVFLQNNPAYPFGEVLGLAASPTFSQTGTFTQLPTTGGGPINCYQKPAVIPPPLVYSFTFNLGTEPLYNFNTGNPDVTVAWTGTFKFTETWAGYCVHGAGRYNPNLIPVFITGEGQGKVVGTYQ
jgi:hypothetical protein